MHYRSIRYASGLLLICVGLLLGPPAALAQDDVGEALQKVGETYADGYTQPITDAFGADLNAGLFRTADVGSGLIPLFPFDVYLGVSTPAMMVSDAQKSFVFEGETIDGPGPATWEVFVDNAPGNEVPTVFGSTDPDGQLVFREQSTGTEVERQDIPPGLTNFSLAPLIVPQLGVGAVAGTDVQVRYLPNTDLSGYGAAGFTGFALRHDVDQWFPAPLPLSLAVQGAWNQLTLEDNNGNQVIDASGWALNVHASKGVPVAPIVFYGGLQYESFGADYNYSFTGPTGETTDISISQDASTSTRVLAGVSFTLAVIRINADYAVTNGPNVINAGLGLRL